MFDVVLKTDWTIIYWSQLNAFSHVDVYKLSIVPKQREREDAFSST